MRRARPRWGAPTRLAAIAARSLFACAGAALVCAPGVLATTVIASSDGAPTSIERGEFANGAAFVVQRVENAPEGQTSIRLVIQRGASADPIGASGAVHVLSHALWDGAMDRLEARASGGGPGSADASELLRAMGGRQHSHRAAPVDMFSMSFEFDLSNSSEPVVREALRVLSEIATLEGFDERSFERAREQALTELRGWASASLRVNQRATKAIFEPMGLAPGPFVGREEEIAALEYATLRGIASSLFTRVGITVVCAAKDVNIALLRDGFRAALPDPAPFCPVFVMPEGLGARGVALADPEAPIVVVETVRVERSLFDEREALLRAAASEAVRRRLVIASESLGGDRALGEFIVFSRAFAPGALGTPGTWLSLVHASGAPGTWEHAMRVVATELRRIEVHGFSEGEARLAFEKALGGLRAEASNERAGSTRDIADRLAMRVSHGLSLVSAEELVREGEAMFDRASADDLRAAAVRAFVGEGAFEAREFVALAAGHAGDETLTDANALRVAKRALTGDVAPPDLASVEPALLERLDEASMTPGRVVEVRVDPASDTLTMTLSNNVVAHHRSMRPGSGQVVIEATVGGGEVDEIEGVTRGVTDAALSAWREPATRALSSRAISDALSGKGIEVSAWSGQDVARLSIRAPSEYVEEAAMIAGALLRSPRVEPAALERWRQTTSARAALADSQPFERLRRELWAVSEVRGDQRVRFPSANDASAITVDDAQAWLDGLLETGSVEVAIVGDVARAQAAALAAKHLAPGRSRPAVRSTTDRVDLPERRVGRIESDVTIGSMSPHGAALVGAYVSSEGSATDWALGEIASRVLSTRVRESLVGDLAIANEARAMWLPIEGWGDFSLVYTPMVAPAERIDEVASAAWGVYERVAREGASDEEFETARETVRRSLASDLDEPESWARVLSDASRRGHSPALMLERRDAILRATPEAMRAFLSSGLERGSVRTIVRPASPE